MNKTVYRSERFRTPSPAERSFGIWVDRIGEADDSTSVDRLRILGLYAAVYIEDGNGIFEGKSTGEIQVESGDIMLLFPKEAASYQPYSHWRTKWIVWDGPEARAMENLGLFAPDKPIIRNRNRIFAETHSELDRLAEENDLHAIFARKLALSKMLLGLLDAQKNNTATGADSNIRIITNEITRKPERSRSIPELAAACNLSQSQFRRRFQRQTGSSPRQFINAAKISKAKEMLAAGQRIKTVADKLGFRNEFYFMRCFKKTAGITAGQFRDTTKS